MQFANDVGKNIPTKVISRSVPRWSKKCGKSVPDSKQKEMQAYPSEHRSPCVSEFFFRLLVTFSLICVSSCYCHLLSSSCHFRCIQVSFSELNMLNFVILLNKSLVHRNYTEKCWHICNLISWKHTYCLYTLNKFRIFFDLISRL